MILNIAGRPFDFEQKKGKWITRDSTFSRKWQKVCLRDQKGTEINSSKQPKNDNILNLIKSMRVFI